MKGLHLTESNWQTHYYPQAKTGPKWLDPDRNRTDDPAAVLLFHGPNDAAHWAAFNGLTDVTIETVEMACRLEYEAPPIWQTQRYYVSAEAGLVAWPGYVQQVTATSHIHHLRLIDLATGEPIAEWRREET